VNSHADKLFNKRKMGHLVRHRGYHCAAGGGDGRETGVKGNDGGG
jgi:hypothetical protein